MADKPKLLEHERAPGRLFDSYDAPEAATLFADGVGRIMMGPGVSKIEFFRVTGTIKETVPGMGSVDVEEREIFARVVVPTVYLIEACAKVIEGAGGALGAMDAAQTNLKKVITDAIQRVRK
jgi:hypothetical protein